MCVLINKYLFIFYNEFYITPATGVVYAPLAAQTHINANDEVSNLLFQSLLSRLDLNLSARISNMKPDA